MSEPAETEEGRAALARAEAAGFHRIAIPTPFAVGRINTYVIEDDPLTLVDTGPNSGLALDRLEQGLAALGHRIEDLGLIILTHQHADHHGLTSILARRSGAEVAAFERLAPFLREYGPQAGADDEFAGGLMRAHGVAHDVISALQAVSAAFRGWGGRCEVTRPIAPGDEIALRDRTLIAHHRPGHSPSDLVFEDRGSRVLVAGDHLIKHISSNPVIHRPLPLPDGSRPDDEDAERPHSLLMYMKSMAATTELDADVILPGHGEPVIDHARLVEERLAMHERRARKLLGGLAGGPKSAHAQATDLWGRVAVTQAYLTLCEVLGHMDLLVERGQVVEQEEDGLVKFAATSQ